MIGIDHPLTNLEKDTSKSQSVWLPVPSIDVFDNSLGKKACYLQTLTIVIQFWNEAFPLSKLQCKIHSHSYGTLFFQVLSVSSFIVVFDSFEARNKALEVSFFWLEKK